MSFLERSDLFVFFSIKTPKPTLPNSLSLSLFNSLLCSTMPTRCEILCEILLAIFLPPVGVCFRHGCCSVEFLICLVLTILGYIPGIIYALYAILCVDRDYNGDQYRSLA
ncbi:hypothetical protein ACSBR1_003787 [Camellia fascicularis]